MRYLLDPNIVSDLIRNPQGKVAQHIRKVGEEQVCTSIIAAAELRYGRPRKVPPGFALRDPGRLLRTPLGQTGRPIGANDLLIAAQALALGYSIITDNEQEVARDEDLRLENWLR